VCVCVAWKNESWRLKWLIFVCDLSISTAEWMQWELCSSKPRSSDLTPSFTALVKTLRPLTHTHTQTLSLPVALQIMYSVMLAGDHCVCLSGPDSSFISASLGCVPASVWGKGFSHCASHTLAGVHLHALFLSPFQNRVSLAALKEIMVSLMLKPPAADVLYLLGQMSKFKLIFQTSF